jgi:hypothetical protein
MSAARLWTHQATVLYLRVPARTLRYLTANGRGPVAFHADKHSRYDPERAREWLAANSMTSRGGAEGGKRR